MRVDTLGGHLTYCTNIHPGESWAQTRANVREHVRDVKAELSPDAPFGVGLRLSGAAAAELEGDELQRFKADLEEWGLYVFTINGFPYGPFHGTPVKENVYRPDWLEPERVGYTRQLIHILAELLPPGVDGSISTVPGCFGARAGEETPRIVANALAGLAADLDRLREEKGVCIVLALEPEPCCFLETISESVEFFTEHLFASGSEAVRRHIGVCLDTCHAAVEFEDPASILGELKSAGIRIAKIQVTTGLRVRPVDAASLAAVQAFADDVYLHQVVARAGDSLHRYVDLAEAVAAFDGKHDEWRVHFHVPVFQEHLPPLENTQAFLRSLLSEVRREQPSRHYELETYTWDVLPDRFREGSVNDAICRELRWVIDEVSR